MSGIVQQRAQQAMVVYDPAGYQQHCLTLIDHVETITGKITKSAETSQDSI
jgi:conjugal transfer/entry exclusion protein